MKTLLLILLTFSLSFPAVVKEVITFLQPDGRSYIIYTSTRSHSTSYGIFFRKDRVSKPEEHLKNYLYIYPENYTWEVGDKVDVLRFPEGSYATMTYGTLENLQILEDGTYLYKSWDGKKYPNGHYGYWNTPSDFDRFTYVWVFPKGFEIVSYESNRPGNWVIRHNTLTYYGSKVNDLVFTIKYRPPGADIYRSLRVKGKKLTTEGVKVELQSQILFAEGSAELSDRGKEVLREMVSSLRGRKVRYIVEGHTDSQPLTGELKKRFKSNWGLAAARAQAVIEFLKSLRVPEDRLELRAYGATKPIATNETEEGRRRNRRIEILIVE